MTPRSAVGVAAGTGSLLSTYLLIHPLDPPDVLGLGDSVELACPFAACASAGALWQRRYAFAVGLFLLVQLLILPMNLLAFSASFGPAAWTSSLLIAGALAGVVLFGILPGAKWWIACGALTGFVGMGACLLLTAVLYPLLPVPLTVLAPHTYAILVPFGPAMGMALGIPFGRAVKSLQCDVVLESRSESPES